MLRRFQLVETYGGVPDNPAAVGSFRQHLGNRDMVSEPISPSMPTCPLCNGDGIQLTLNSIGIIKEGQCRLCEGRGVIPRAVFEKVQREVNFRLCEGD